MADLKNKQIRDSYMDVLTKGTGNTVEDGDGNPFDIFNRAFTAGGLVRLPSGINFNASGGDTLSDYEVGTFTPNYTGSAGGSGGNITAIGDYIKIGNIIVGVFRVRATRGTLDGDITITGMPFSLLIGGATIGYKRRFETNMPNLVARTEGSVISLWKNPTNGEANEVKHTDLNAGTGNQNDLNITFAGIIS